jgi:ferredoxin-NADP reductase/ferredoxin
MTVSEVDALLYLPGRSRSQLERALRIPALSAGWRGSFQSLLSETEAKSERITAPAWPGFRAMRVSGKVRESASVMSLTLEPIDELAPTAALPGQFVVLRLALAPEGSPKLRSYSLSGDPGARDYRISVKREPRGAASAFIHDIVQVGDVLEISAPRGEFTVPADEAPLVLLSAGVGATPLLAMLHALASQSAKREVWWIYGARNGREHPFAGEVRGLLSSLSHARRHIRYSSPDPGDRQGVDFDASGHVGIDTLRELTPPGNAEYLICGPPSFMSDMTAALETCGVARGRIHTEVFGAGPSRTPGVVASARGTPHAPEATSEIGPMVSFARSGLSVHWGTRFRSLLELAEACDIPTRWACRTGVCHTCETGLVAGTLAYSPDPLTPAAVGAALICCSRPINDVVIDL